MKKLFIEAAIAALKNANLNSKSSMIGTITTTLTMLENALAEDEPKLEPIENKELLYGDENPDYIKMSQEEI